jgi:hypothetical protein
VVQGHIVPSAAGSTLEGHLRLSIPTAIVMGIWMTAVIVGATAGVLAAFSSGDYTPLLAVAMPLFGGGLIAIGFVPESRKIRRILQAELTKPPT